MVERFKKSKFEWFDEIPLSWSESKISYLFEIGRGRVISQQELKEDGMYPVYSSQTKDNGCMGMIDTYDFDDNLITWTTDGANAGTIFIREGKFNCTNVCGTLKPILDIELKYYYYYLQFVTQFYKRPDTNGAKIMNNEMANIHTLIPPKETQIRIAEFLDKKTAEIDTIIQKKENLLLLLEEKKKAIINEAVTKGINPNAPMKDSGIEWIGEIPEHWEVSKLKYFVSIKGRLGWKGLKADEYVESGYGFLSTPDIKNDEIDFSRVNYITEERYLESPEIMLEKGDVLLVKDGSTLGIINRVKELPIPSTVNSSIAVLRIEDSSIISEFLFYLLKSNWIQKTIEFLKQGQGVPHLFQKDIKEFDLIIPPIAEQETLINEIYSRCKIVDDLNVKIQSQIDKLKEYRQSLISEAVTGKIDI